MMGILIPVLEDALHRSLSLAAAMDSRGFGRSDAAPGARRLTGALTGAGLLGVCVGVYGLLDAQSPGALGLPMLLVGCAFAAVGLAVGGRRATRTRYRPDPWAAPEWGVALSGLVAAAAAVVASRGDGLAAMQPDPTELPPLPLLAVAGVLVALLPAWLAPVPETPPEPEPPPAPARDDVLAQESAEVATR